VRKAMSYEYYKTKLAMKIITKMTRDDAYELFRVVQKVEDAICVNGIVCAPVEGSDKKQAIPLIENTLEDAGVEIPEHLREPFWKFMEVMINERAHIEELVWEYNRALAPVIRYGLFEPDT